jgi:hypothetical protein
MADNLPSNVIIDHILPFVDRSTWDNHVVANREMHQESRNLKAQAPWPVGELIRGVDYERDVITQICFSSDGEYIFVFSWEDHGPCRTI